MDILTDLKNHVLGYYDVLIATIPRVVMAIVIVGLVLLVLRAVRRKITNTISRNADDVLLINFFGSLLRIINIILGILLFLYIIGQFGLAGSILGAATISSVVIGFAFKDIAENFLAGVILAFNRPFKIGDTVKTQSVEGNIVSMSLREIQIKTFDGKDVFVPNGQIIKNPLYNYTTDGHLRKSFTVGVDYATDLLKARIIIQEVLASIPGIIQEGKAPSTVVNELGTSTVNIDVHFWIDTYDKSYSFADIKSEALYKVLQALEKNEISLPADIVELKNYNSETLQVKGKEEEKQIA